jgi:hypothetical protein
MEEIEPYAEALADIATATDIAAGDTTEIALANSLFYAEASAFYIEMSAYMLEISGLPLISNGQLDDIADEMKRLNSYYYDFPIGGQTDIENLMEDYVANPIGEFLSNQTENLINSQEDYSNQISQLGTILTQINSTLEMLFDMEEFFTLNITSNVNQIHEDVDYLATNSDLSMLALQTDNVGQRFWLVKQCGSTFQNNTC